MLTEPELLSTTGQLGHYDIDVSRSAITFRTRHLFGLGPVTGTFAFRSGSVDVAEPIAESSVHAEIETASFDTGNRQRDRAVISPRFLDSAHFPVMIFSSGQVSADGKTVSGMLTVRDVTRPVTFAVGQVAVSGQSFTAVATVRIDRTEFGVTASAGLAGRYLDLAVEVQCVRK